MIRLDSGVETMLERSHFYNFSGYSSMDGHDALVEITPLRDYQFFLPNCFLNRSERNSEYFESKVRLFVQKYLFNWARKIKETKKDFDSLDFGNEVTSFFNGFKCEEIFEKIVTGKNYSKIEVKPNNTVFKIKRFGDILGFGIGNPHKSGTVTILKMCRREDPGNNQGIYELIDKIKTSISFASICAEGKFGSSFFDELKLALRYVSWKSDINSDNLVERYKNSDNYDIIIGSYHGFNIVMDIVHSSAKNIQDIKHANYYNQDEARILRQANAEGSNGNYCFKSWQDLVITFTLKSSLPNFMNNMEIDFEAHSEQFRLIHAGSSFSSQLCSMVMDGWLKLQGQN